jgi:hypothetical protein
MQRIVTVVVILIGCGLAGAGVYLVILGPEATLTQVTVATIEPGDQEIAWLHPATNATTWERFVAGMKELPGLELDETAAFPEDSMKLPAVSLSKKGIPGRLWIRWYKLTGLRTTEVWVNDLCRRRPLPLGIVGGGNSERAREVAMQLAHQRRRLDRDFLEKAKRSKTPNTAAVTLPQLPVLLITNATADLVQHPDFGTIDLMYIYTDRSFRFCYTNRQMAEAVCDFTREQISQDSSLQITSSRISLLSWQDDPFSGDLAQQFAENWMIPTGSTPAPSTWSRRIAHSIGSLNQPNRLEAQAISELVKDSAAATVRGRELLVIPGAVAPVRRILRGLLRTDPNERFLWVATAGDAIDWNTIYRDRRLTWPIEDVPFPLILFMHRNPVERNLSHDHGFRPEVEPPVLATPTGTDDLLLYRDISQALVHACFQDGKLLDDSDMLVFRLREEKDEQGFSIFDALGNRSGKGGEYITLLRPLFDGLQLLPRSQIEVFNRDPGTQQWKKIESLQADYGSTGSTARTSTRTRSGP